MDKKIFTKTKESEVIANHEAKKYILAQNPRSLQDGFNLYLTGLAISKQSKAIMIRFYKIDPKVFSEIEKAVMK